MSENGLADGELGERKLAELVSASHRSAVLVRFHASGSIPDFAHDGLERLQELPLPFGSGSSVLDQSKLCMKGVGDQERRIVDQFQRSDRVLGVDLDILQDLVLLHTVRHRHGVFHFHGLLEGDQIVRNVCLLANVLHEQFADKLEFVLWALKGLQENVPVPTRLHDLPVEEQIDHPVVEELSVVAERAIVAVVEAQFRLREQRAKDVKYPACHLENLPAELWGRRALSVPFQEPGSHKPQLNDFLDKASQAHFVVASIHRLVRQADQGVYDGARQGEHHVFELATSLLKRLCPREGVVVRAYSGSVLQIIPKNFGEVLEGKDNSGTRSRVLRFGDIADLVPLVHRQKLFHLSAVHVPSGVPAPSADAAPRRFPSAFPAVHARHGLIAFDAPVHRQRGPRVHVNDDLEGVPFRSNDFCWGASRVQPPQTQVRLVRQEGVVIRVVFYHCQYFLHRVVWDANGPCRALLGQDLNKPEAIPFVHRTLRPPRDPAFLFLHTVVSPPPRPLGSLGPLHPIHHRRVIRPVTVQNARKRRFQRTRPARGVHHELVVPSFASAAFFRAQGLPRSDPDGTPRHLSWTLLLDSTHFTLSPPKQAQQGGLPLLLPPSHGG
mmetsp:Transcript_3041/g.8248  ORF Transcript_3041/g.8248 Transcript_3041/m.8248 type:complete len:609 (+) Transcript_3041:359-2185(+)